MKFIGITTRYNISKDKIKIAISVAATVCFCIVSFFTVDALLKAQTAAEKKAEAERLASLYEAAQTAVSDVNVQVSDVNNEANQTTAATYPSATVATESTELSDNSETTSDTDNTDATTTVQTQSETELITTVYAYGTMNVRSGPGMNYGVVKTLNAGDQIDVVAVTGNGWYRTYNSNYVLAELCSNQPIHVATPTPVPQPTRAPSSNGSSSSNGMTYYGSCYITYYGPQLRSDGTYSTSTASGTTCSQGCTVAADWGVFPSGTTIYISGDPLGGDGYYTVEDRGPGVNGSHIDIYADDGQSGAYQPGYYEVYVVN